MELLSTLINSVIGMAVVFAVLIILMVIISIMSKIMKKKPADVQAPAPAPAAAAPAADAPAPGSCGEVKLFDVPDKIAAQLMAITAEQLGAPLNTLRFISIKEVK